MATKKTTKQSARKTTKKGAKKSTKKAAQKRPAKGGSHRPARGDKAEGVLRVRMYRIGFGDFFLLTVPTKDGPQHILIDCGVHAGNIGTMDECVQDLIKETDRKLALVIATHYHADHLSGFASNFDDFAQFEVGMVWLPNRLDPANKEAVKLQAQINSVAGQLRMGLRLRLGLKDEEEPGAGVELAQAQALYMVDNALGIQLGAKEREGGNEKALRLLTKGFKNKPPVRYYQGGDDPELPDVLKGEISAQLLGPAPLDSGGMFSGPDNWTMQYLAAAGEEGVPETECLEPFEAKWMGVTDANAYPKEAFRDFIGSHAGMEKVIHAAQPDVMLAMAKAVDGTLNNQSLVVLFNCRGKNLLFVGDAQWGNWSYWLYGREVKGKEKPNISESARGILGSIDFYKVGHHGSTNSTPIPAVEALNENCVSMCSTESADYDPTKRRPHGHPDNDSEVPRTVLMEALEKQTKFKLVRSDYIPVADVPASPEALSQLPRLPKNFSAGELYLDYVFPT